MYKIRKSGWMSWMLQASVVALLSACGGSNNSAVSTASQTQTSNPPPATADGSFPQNVLAPTTKTASSLSANTAKGLASSSPAPQILFTDTLSAPTTGGENNQGGYLSIFGKNFGSASDLGTNTRVYINDKEVANYRYLGNAKSSAKTGLQQITVQVGSLEGAPAGGALPVKVVYNGASSNTDNNFTPTSGRVLFVSLSGSDTTAVANNIAKPWRSLQNMSTLKGAYFAMQAGDQLVVRGGAWHDTNGQDKTWMRFGGGIYARNGSPAAWIHITAYPGPVNGNAIEDVHYTTPVGASGGISGPWSAIAGSTGEYISVSNLRMDVAGGASRDAAPVNFQYTAGPWRVVNNELGPWIAGNSATLNAAGVSGHGKGNRVLGNNIHDIAGTSELQNHGIYADTTAQDWEVAYNWIHNITGGSAVQFNDNEGGAGSYTLPHGGIWQGFTGIRIHHNWLENAAKYGINFNDQGSTHKGTYEAQSWNNVITGTKLYPIRINSTATIQNMWFAYNTVYNAMTGASGNKAYVMDEGFGSGAGIRNKFYNNIFAFGPDTQPGTTWLIDYSTPSTTTSYDFKQNLYFSNGQTAPTPGTLGDNLAISGNPQFKNAASANYTLLATSPAVDAATQPGIFAVNDDISNTARPQGNSKDIGAFELSGAVVPIPTPVNGMCGTANGQSFSAAPSSQLCSSGIASLVSTTNTGWAWSCSGSNGGTTASCSANLASNPDPSTPPSVRQQYSGVITAGTSRHQLPSTVSAGNWILVTVGINNNALGVSGTLSDNQGHADIGSFTSLGRIYVDGMGTDLYAVKATTSGTYTLSVGIPNQGSIHVVEIQNADTVNLLDAPLTTSAGPRFASTALSSPTQTSTRANDLVLALIDLGIGNAIPFSPNGSWQLVSPEAGTYITSRIYEQRPAAIGAFGISGTVGGSGAGYPGWEAALIVIKGQ
ncbi:choice-of-anchor Q domain-containing protein [Undibacterium sp. Tian12W]|uniref:choice-of-anchor Q domain-containing protein n=1 Tax=Undibacterium sp. Tian12W TaxID=3413054 RepID=UPI003BF3FE77